MKRKLFFVVVFVALLIAACSPMTRSQAVQLPEELVVLVGMGVSVLFTAAAKWLFDQFNVDLSDRLAEIASAVSAILVVAINYLIGLVPAEYDNILMAVLAFLIVWLGGTGIYSLFFRKKAR